MNIYTMGFTQKSAEEFFKRITDNQIEILIDIRLNNQSQLAGFSKGKDLQYFLRAISNCGYSHEVKFAPTKELLNDYKKGLKSWEEYVVIYNQLIEQRKMVEYFENKYQKYQNVLLLCSEATPGQCHRRLLAEAIQKRLSYGIKHL